jgi:hypothetical protein
VTVTWLNKLEPDMNVKKTTSNNNILNVTKLVKTKIVCTLGPISSNAEMLEKMILAGMDIVRLNFSHGDHEDFRKLFNTVCDSFKLVYICVLFAPLFLSFLVSPSDS